MRGSEYLYREAYGTPHYEILIPMSDMSVMVPQQPVQLKDPDPSRANRPHAGHSHGLHVYP